MDDSIGSNTTSWDADTFEHWLEQIADSRDVSNEEVLTQLASSLWVLDELEALIDETDIHSEIPVEPNTQHKPRNPNSELTALSERLDALETRLNDLETGHHSLADDTSDDIDNIEEVLRYLVDRTDTLSEQLSRLDDQLETVKTQLQDWQKTQSKVVELKTEATRQGITTPECEQCGNTVQLATLARPECPTCSHPFDTITPNDSWFGTPTIGNESPQQPTQPPQTTPDDITSTDADQPPTTDTSDVSSIPDLDLTNTTTASTKTPEETSSERNSRPSTSGGDEDSTAFQWQSE